MSSDAAVAIDNRRRAAVRAILAVKDGVDPLVPDDVSLKLRQVIMREVNGFAEFATSLLEIVRQDGDVVNQMWLDDIDRKLNLLVAVLVPEDE